MADIRINALTNTATSAASDDYLALDGSANGTRKILATNVAQNVTDVTFGSSGPSAKSSIAARAARQGLVLDGASYATFTLPTAIGTNDCTIFGWARATGADGEIALTGSSSTGCLTVRRASGAWLITNSVLANVGSFAGSLPSGTFAWAYTRNGTTGTLYINGVSLGTITDSANYNGTNYQLGAYQATRFWPGYISLGGVENRALSAAEVVALYEAGVPAGADYASPAATNTNVITGDAWWDTKTGSVSSGTITLASGEYALRGSVLTKGKRYRTTYNVTALTGTVNVGNTSANPTVVQAVTSGTGSFEFTAGDNGAFGFNAISGTATITSVTLVPVGLLLAPDAGQAGNGYVWNDMSGNVAQIALPSSGVTWNVPSIAGNRIRGTTNTNGNQQLLGASVLLPAESQILHVRARSRSGTPSITIGTSSGGAEIVASVALSTTWKNLTIALTGGIVSSADDIWIGSNSTDVVETDISWQPLDF